MTELIAKKRDNGELERSEIAFFVRGCTDASLPDYQISAMLMAMYLRGLNERETTALTLEMAKSGDMLDLSPLGDKTVDKHSTGGVGDKTTLIVAPIAAALGCTVAKMSGRGLGHTGGTVDKLESIDGFRTSLTTEEFLRNARETGLCLAGHSGNLAPADKRLYALRDVTATVDSIPLIAASIMSKKLAAGAENILLDVKYGSGAFMKTPDKAEILAREMITIGRNAGRKTAAMITCMDTPLGFAIGNSLEIKEAVNVLHGNGPDDLTELCTALAAVMYRLCTGNEISFCREAVLRTIADKSALDRLIAAVASQGGDTDMITGKHSFKPPQSQKAVLAAHTGYITQTDCELIGKAAVISGAGRETKDDIIDPSAGILLSAKPGDYVNKDDKIADVFGCDDRLDEAARLLSDSFSFGDKKPQYTPLIYKTIY